MKWSTELRQDPHREQIDAEQRLSSCDDAYPADGFERVLASLQATNPLAGGELFVADVDRREEGEIGADRSAPAICLDDVLLRSFSAMG